MAQTCKPPSSPTELCPLPRLHLAMAQLKAGVAAGSESTSAEKPAAIPSAGQTAVPKENFPNLKMLLTKQPAAAHSAEQPESKPGDGCRLPLIDTALSAEQPESKPGDGCGLPLINTLDDCKSWADSMPTGAKPVGRISEAIAILQAPRSRKRRSELQSLCKQWAVDQKHAHKKRRLSEIESQLAGKILQHANCLKKLHAQHEHFSSIAAAMQLSGGSAEQPASSTS